MSTLKYTALCSQGKAEFWINLEKKKLNELRLSTEELPMRYPFAPSDDGALTRLTLSGDSFDLTSTPGYHEFAVRGGLYICNTIEEFKSFKWKEYAELKAREVWGKIRSGEWLDDPLSLLPAYVVCFADLKAHKFWYQCFTPSLSPKPPTEAVGAVRKLSEVWSEPQLRAFKETYSAFWEEHRCPVFGITMSEDVAVVVPVRALTAEGLQDGSQFLGVVDMSASTTPAWTVRNPALATAVSLGVSDFSVVCLRENIIAQTFANSLVIKVRRTIHDLGPSPSSELPDLPPWVSTFCDGCERQPPMADMAYMLDDKLLAQSSSRLNLSLMKWRMVPSLDLDGIAKTRCLLVGSGTLGCNVARNLMMWGIHDITFIDFGKVSFSNPVRQTLFTHEDALHGGKNKAQAAAEACRRIYPLSEAKWEEMMIPMPGHPSGPAERADVAKKVERLGELVREHDVIFLLTDSRESRWLPTVLASYHKKMAINAALGFDTYMVMRHGMPGAANRYGCYFCSDITAPSDSLSDRTLDQQCTVTRPGVSAIASALAVELMVSLLSHKAGASASVADESLLGMVPHQIRGGLGSFEQMHLTGQHFSQCVACSDKICEEFGKRGADFVLDAMNGADKVLLDISGISEMLKEGEGALKDFDDFVLDSDEESGGACASSSQQ